MLLIILIIYYFREYPTGWMVSTAERNWKFRVSIVYAKHEVNFLNFLNKIFLYTRNL